MVKLRFKYIVEDIDRHGNVRLYFRRKGQAKLRLPGIPGSDEFMAAYSSALMSSEQQQPQRLQRAGKGAFGHVCRAYYASTTFRALDASTQSWRRRALDAICVKHGDKPVAQMSGKHVRMLRDEKADLPGQLGTGSRYCAHYSAGRWKKTRHHTIQRLALRLSPM